MTNQRAHTRRAGFTLIELLVVIAIIALLIGILLPALGRARLAGQKVTSASSQRQVLIGMANFSGDNKGFYPGVSAFGGSMNKVFTDASKIDNFSLSGGSAGRHVPARYLLLLQDDYINGEVLIGPMEPRESLPDVDVAGVTADNYRGGVNPTQPIWVEYQSGGWTASNGLQADYTHRTVFYSYALLDLFNDDNGPFENVVRGWSTEAGAETPIMSDRLIFWDDNAKAGNGDEPFRQSLWTKGYDGWVGHIGFGDAHVDWYDEPLLNRTRFGQRVTEGTRDYQSGDLENRDGDNIFKIDTGFGDRTQDVGMVIGWGSQTFRTAEGRNGGR